MLLISCAQAALSLGDLIDDSFEIGDRLREAVVERGIVDQLAQRTFAALREGQDAVGALEQRVHVLQRALAGAHHLVEVRMHLRGKRVAILRHRADGLRAVDVQVGFAEHSGRIERGHRIAAEVEAVLRAHFHDHFDRSELLVFVRHHANGRNVADIHAARAAPARPPAIHSHCRRRIPA